MGGQRLEYRKKVWSIYDADEKAEVERGIRYGENPDQPAALVRAVNGNIVPRRRALLRPDSGLVSRITEKEQLQVGKHPGKINLTDVDNALNILGFLDTKPACSIMKHNNPCGAAYGSTAAEAFEKAFWCDRIAAFGGAVVFTRAVDVETAKAMAPYYFEVVCAPDFEGPRPRPAEEVEEPEDPPDRGDREAPGIQGEEDHRLQVPHGRGPHHPGIPALHDQGREDLKAAQTTYKGEVHKIKRAPTERELEDMLFGWHVESGVSSNSALFVKDGDGRHRDRRAGQGRRRGDRRVQGVQEVHGRPGLQEVRRPLRGLQAGGREGLKADGGLKGGGGGDKGARAGLLGSVVVSDGFFPFRDGVDAAIVEGATGVIQPGGSERDFEVIEACNEAGVTMVFTGQRLFKH